MALIVFEGVDGSGKTFLAKQLAKENNWVYIKTPPKALSIKLKCNNEENELNRYKKGLLINAKIIQKKLLEGKTIVCDRYYATYVVDSLRLGIELDKRMKNLLPNPTKTILLIASWETIVKRLNQRDEKSIFETKLIADKKVYDKAIEEFRRFGYEEKEND